MNTLWKVCAKKIVFVGGRLLPFYRFRLPGAGLIFSFFMLPLPQKINFRLYFQNINERRWPNKKYDRRSQRNDKGTESGKGKPPFLFVLHFNDNSANVVQFVVHVMMVLFGKIVLKSLTGNHNENTIRDGCSTALYTAYTGYTVFTNQTAVHFLNTCLYTGCFLTGTP